MDGPGRVEIFCTRRGRPWGSPTFLYSRYFSIFLGFRGPGSDVDNPHISSADVRERVQISVYSPSGPSLPDLLELYPLTYEDWNFNSGNYLFTTDTK